MQRCGNCSLLYASSTYEVEFTNQLYNEKRDCHLNGRNEEELKKLENKLSYSFSVCDVLKINFTKNIFFREKMRESLDENLKILKWDANWWTKKRKFNRNLET